MKTKYAAMLIHGGVGILPTDTLYGIVGSALNKKTVLRIYKLRKRNPKKPFIILISSLADLKNFGIFPAVVTRHYSAPHPPKQVFSAMRPHSRKNLNEFRVVLPTTDYQLLTKLWPGKVSVILPCTSKKFAYLHRGTKTLAFRYPKPKWLQNLLKTTGPLVAPSANSEGEPPAKTITQARKYFGDRVDFYVSRGTLVGKPSTLVAIKNNEVMVLRKGSARITKIRFEK